ncbi:MAG: hypothetical protein ACI841_003095 [Planctomycetota bacterium]|jgi:hypothetical protein
MSSPTELDPNGLLAELLTADDRDHCPGARPIVSYRDDDEASYLGELDKHASTRIDLHRRGHWHGLYAELESDSLVPPAGPPREALLEQRWHTARPIVLPGLVDLEAPQLASIASRAQLHEQLQKRGGLRAFSNSTLADSSGAFRVDDTERKPGHDGRDIERISIHWRESDQEGAKAMESLWGKSGWLADLDDDTSLRMRLSFGREVDDDASRKLDGHRRVSELGAQLFPETQALATHPWLNEFLERQVDGPVFFTQHIAYWNALGGGALMHHDAFHEPIEGGQRGVLYTQLSGATLWFAVSIEDLCRRVIEFVGYLEDGELAWVRKQLFPRPDDFDFVVRMCKRFPRVRKELGRAGCGKLSALVNQGPEFSALLADAGHAVILRAGDAILLPNQGLERTCMHSVFGVSEEPGFALSLAIRESEPSAPPEPAQNSDRGDRRDHPRRGGGGRRGRRSSSRGRR